MKRNLLHIVIYTDASSYAGERKATMLTSTNLTTPSDLEISQRKRDKTAKQERLDDALDEGLEETFPGSDAVALTQPKADKPKAKEKR